MKYHPRLLLSSLSDDVVSEIRLTSRGPCPTCQKPVAWLIFVTEWETFPHWGEAQCTLAGDYWTDDCPGARVLLT